MVAIMNTLKLPRTAESDTGADRRVFPRTPSRDHVDGLRLDHTLGAYRMPHIRLSLRDVSLGGLSALTAAPLNRGERLSVSFPARGLRQGWDAYGRVIRCEPSALGWRVAVEFDPLPAA